MAKFEIELPDDHLALLANVAHYARETPEDCLSRVAREGLDAAGDALRRKIEERLGPPRAMGGESARIIREMRDQRLPPAYREKQSDD